MPFASVIGPVPAATGWGMSTAVVLRMAERADKRHEAVLGVVNGLFLTTVLAHFIHWPKRWRFGVPSLSSAKDYAAQSWCLTTVFFTFRGSVL